VTWNELIAESRAAGVLAFCSEGIAVLQRDNATPPPPENGSSEQVSREHREQGRQSRQGQGQSAPE
jgi:hypothetical protein